MRAISFSLSRDFILYLYLWKCNHFSFPTYETWREERRGKRRYRKKGAKTKQTYIFVVERTFVYGNGFGQSPSVGKSQSTYSPKPGNQYFPVWRGSLFLIINKSEAVQNIIYARYNSFCAWTLNIRCIFSDTNYRLIKILIKHLIKQSSDIY